MLLMLKWKPRHSTTSMIRKIKMFTIITEDLDTALHRMNRLETLKVVTRGKISTHSCDLRNSIMWAYWIIFCRIVIKIVQNLTTIRVSQTSRDAKKTESNLTTFYSNSKVSNSQMRLASYHQAAISSRLQKWLKWKRVETNKFMVVVSEPITQIIQGPKFPTW